MHICFFIGIFFKSDIKHSYLFHPIHQDGYFPFQSENASGYDKKDLKEFYHIYPWGRYPLEINEQTKLFYVVSRIYFNASILE